MPSVVIKLGSSVVAHDDGTIRIDVLSRICDDVAALYATGYDPVVVTSGAIARGLGEMKIPPAQRPRAIDHGGNRKKYDRAAGDLTGSDFQRRYALKTAAVDPCETVCERCAKAGDLPHCIAATDAGDCRGSNQNGDP